MPLIGSPKSFEVVSTMSSGSSFSSGISSASSVSANSLPVVNDAGHHGNLHRRGPGAKMEFKPSTFRVTTGMTICSDNDTAHLKLLLLPTPSLTPETTSKSDSKVSSNSAVAPDARHGTCSQSVKVKRHTSGCGLSLGNIYSIKSSAGRASIGNGSEAPGALCTLM